MSSVPRVVLVLALGVAAALSGADRLISAADPALHPQTFIDLRTGMSISAQLDPAAPDAGHWVMRVPSGTYSGDAGSAMKVNSPTSAVINYDGSATLYRLEQGPSTRAIRLHAQLDTIHHTAEATLWDGSERFHLVARAADVGGLNEAIRGVERAISADDPAALYPLLNQRLTAAYDIAAFTAYWRSESASRGRVTALRRISTGPTEVTDQGHWFVAIRYSADIATASGTGAAEFVAFFIHEPTGWKLWTTSRR